MERRDTLQLDGKKDIVKLLTDGGIPPPLNPNRKINVEWQLDQNKQIQEKTS